MNLDLVENRKGLIIVTCETLVFLCYLFKYAFGAIYVWSFSFPPKKSYEFIYRGKLGHYQWRVQRAKFLRKKTINYFIMSSIAIIFGIMQTIVVDACFYFFMGKHGFMITKFVMEFCVMYYQLYSWRKIKAHMKELDRLVTIRY